MTEKDKLSVAEIYQLQPSYKRFDQRYNMTRQVLWKTSMINLHAKRTVNLRNLLEKEKPGYRLTDLAFNRGAEVHAWMTSRPNYKGSSWQPIKKRVLEKVWKGTPSEASQTVKKVAKLYGADQIGLCHLDRRWVYSHYFDEDTKESFPIRFSDEPEYELYTEPTQLEDGTQVIPKEMNHAVVLVFEEEAHGMSMAPTLTEMATTRVAYSRIAFTTVMVAEFLRGLGYNAIPSSNCTALSIPLAIEAGLGQLGRNAKLITPQYGPRCRISKVITDLPLEHDSPINFGVTEFCSACKRCAEKCPAKAIPLGDRSYKTINECNNGGFLAWHLNHKKCYHYWAKVGTNCGICIAVCPYNTEYEKYDMPTKSFWNI